jgi:hypothetical protein
MRLNSIIKQRVVVSLMVSSVVALSSGCIPLHRHPSHSPATNPASNPASNPSTEPMAFQPPTTQPSVATGELGSASSVPGVNPKPKPFIALPKVFVTAVAAKPSTLLLEHASPDSPVPLSDFAKQPLHTLDSFHLHKGMTADQVQQKFGLPAQLADTEDPWLVYRLTGFRELWLHFGGADQMLDAADVIRSAEDGYVRDRVFSAE